MLKPFFAAAMLAPTRQRSFRWIAMVHVVCCAALALGAIQYNNDATMLSIGYLTLVLGIVEGSTLIGWRLTQLPKSLALEFLLTTPISSRGLFLAESLVGMARFSLIWLSGLPILGLMVFTGRIDWNEYIVLALMPYLWGLLAGLVLTMWIYEWSIIRRIGEIFAMFGIFIYLVVGVIAGENIVLWLSHLPDSIGKAGYHAVLFFHNMNPFGIVRYWFANDRADWLAWERFGWLNGAAIAITLAAWLRGMARLKGHFHDRHYKPIDSKRADQLSQIGDRPLAWWAVRRVMEYSGRINLYLAGGFSLIYAAYMIAGDAWPPWMGRIVFQIFEQWGGAPVAATAMVVMAAVPASFQYGLWDATVPARCKRLELLLLTDLDGRDYWHASLLAAWSRGRGYYISALLYWAALGISGRCEWSQILASMFGGLLLWGISFAVGFRAFTSGTQTSGLATMMTLGLPLISIATFRMGQPVLGNFVPTGLPYMPLVEGITWYWLIGCVVTVIGGATLTWYGIQQCEHDLRKWYDANQGQKTNA